MEPSDPGDDNVRPTDSTPAHPSQLPPPPPPSHTKIISRVSYTSADDEPYHPSPLAMIAQRTHKSRRAAAKLHKKVSSNILKNSESKQAMLDLANDLSFLGADSMTSPPNSPPRIARVPTAAADDEQRKKYSMGQTIMEGIPSAADRAASLGEPPEPRLSVIPNTSLSASHDSMRSMVGAESSANVMGSNDKRNSQVNVKKGFLSELFSGDSSKKKRNRALSAGGSGRGESGEGVCAKCTQRACLFVSSSSATWHDERYGKMTNSAWLVQLLLCVVITLLVLFDIVKIVSHPDGIASVLKDSATITEESTADIATAFFIPCGLAFVLFVVGFFFIKKSNKEDQFKLDAEKEAAKTAARNMSRVSVLKMVPADKFQPNIRFRKLILAAFYIAIGFMIVVTEISTQWYGFMDSAIWVLVGWVGTMSPFGFRGNVTIGGTIVCMYTVSLLFGTSYSVLKASTPQKLWQLFVLLYIPNLLIGVFIEEQIEQAAKLTRKEADGVEELEEQLQYGKTLLETVLPKPIIRMVKQMSQVKDAAIAHKYECCTITFIKFVGIHYLFENKPTVLVMDTVDKLYRKIDRLTDKHLVEKIKTVGDVYMAATGIPNRTEHHAIIMADFCFDVAESVRHFSSRKKVALSFQIGMSSGPIVAGVIGKNKFTYDLWGDAANTASRMYSFGKKGKIQTTKSTVVLIQTHYRCSKANNGEKVMIKGKGMMMCYYVDGRLPSYPASVRMSKSAEVEQIEEKYLMRDDDNGKKDNDQFAKRLKGGMTTGVGKALWVPDSQAANCMECEKSFTMLFRRHHCRYCGRLLCSECTSKKLYKDRVCDRCLSTWADQAMRNVFLHMAKMRRIQEKQGKAHHNFEKPYLAMYHCCRSGTSRSLEFEYLVKRKKSVRSLLLYSWFTVLVLFVIANHVINDFLLPFRCVNTTSGKSTDCDKFDVTNGDGTTFGGTGQAVLYTSQTKSDFTSTEHRQVIIDSLDAVAISQGVNVSDGIARAEVKRKEAKDKLINVESKPIASWSTLMPVEQYSLPFFGIFDDNNLVVLSYTHEGSTSIPEYSIARLMYAKTMMSFGIVPMLVGFILISMIDYRISTNKEFLKHMSAETARDPGKPAPGMYTAADQKWIAIQVAGLLVVMTALGVCLAAQSAFGGGTYHGYLFLFIVWVTNICNDVPAFYCSLVTLIWTFVYLALILTNDAAVAGEFKAAAPTAASSELSFFLNEHETVSSLLTFFVEKFLPVVLLAILAGRKLEAKTRFQFTKQLSHRDTMRTAEIEKRKNFELVPLPLAIRELMRKCADDGVEQQIVIDAFGSVLFADIVSFTVFSTGMDPMDLVLVLNEMFSMHDTLATRMGVNKIKTLGDCYVASTGLLAPTPNHASLLVKFGIGMHDIMDKLNTKFDIHGKGPAGKDLRIRVGVATGTVVGGVVGMKKFLFDIWGDTVEQAELMESEGVPQRVHVSNTTYDRAGKDSDLRFELDDKSRHDNGSIDGYSGNSWLAVIPGQCKGYEKTIQEWIDELFPLPKTKEELEDAPLVTEPKKKMRAHTDSYGDMHEIMNEDDEGWRSQPHEHEHEHAVDFGEERKEGDSKGSEIELTPMKNMGSPNKQMGADQSTKSTVSGGGSSGGGGDDDGSSGSSSAGKKSPVRRLKSSRRQISATGKIQRTPSMQSVLTGDEEPIFEGIPSFEGNNTTSKVKKKNKERLNRRKQYRASFYGGPPPAVPASPRSSADAASSAYERQVAGDVKVVDEPNAMTSNPMKRNV